MIFYKNAPLTTLMNTLVSILISVGITYAINFWLGNGDLGIGLLFAVVVPTVIAPLASYGYFKTYYQLLATRKELELLSQIDSLTTVYNRRYFNELSQAQLALAARHGTPATLLLFDLDNFKQINDTHGHLVGDEALRQTALRIKRVLRQTDILGRYGGDEFILLLPHTDADQAVEIAARVLAASANPDVSNGVAYSPITVSLGIAPTSRFGYWIDDLIHHADAALYQAKNQGRNRYVIAGQLTLLTVSPQRFRSTYFSPPPLQ